MPDRHLEPITREELIHLLLEVRAKGWIESGRHGNVGGVGNTLEDLLGIEENNLPIPNHGEWELKTHRLNSTSHMTLFHCEPSPRALRFVPTRFLPKYGWAHAEAGTRYSESELSFRQTISAASWSDRGFKVVLDKDERKVLVSFDATKADPQHASWLEAVSCKAGLGELDPQPYWGFDDLSHKAGSKLLNCFYIGAESKRIDGKEHFHYQEICILEQFTLDGLLDALQGGWAFVDFDARTGHNHGTKFRVRQDKFASLYQTKTSL